MKTEKAVALFAAMIGAIGIAACPKPQETNVCAGNQTPLCVNGCVELRFVTTRHWDCMGDDSEVKCEPGQGTVGGTEYVYEQQRDASGCVSCLSTVISGPTAVSVVCRAARESEEACDQ